MARQPPRRRDNGRPLHILLSDADVVVGHRDGCLIVVFRGASRPSFPEDMHRWVQSQIHREGAELFAMVIVYEASIEVPQGALRERWAASMKECDPQVSLVVNCLPTTGFAAAVVRMTFSAINLITKAPFEAVVAASTESSAEHVGRRMNIDADEIYEDIEKVRAMPAQTPRLTP